MAKPKSGGVRGFFKMLLSAPKPKAYPHPKKPQKRVKKAKPRKGGKK
jgi:hypothetical protein